MAIKNVALIGANGNLGTEALRALISAGHFTVTVVKRESSSSALPDTQANQVSVKTVDDALSLQSLKAALAGQDAVVVCIPLRDPEQHLRIADAAAAVGVRRLIPADYGSCDSSSRRVQELVPLFKHKTDVRARLQKHAATSSSGFAWTSLVVGHFFDWGLRENFLHFDLRRRSALILDHGEYKSSTSTLPRVAEAIVGILRGDKEETKNKVLFVQSFCVSQLDVLAALEKATSGEWEKKYVDSGEFIAEKKEMADKGDKQAVEDLVFALGALDGNWEERGDFAMGMLGLEDEDLGEVVKRVVESAKSET